MMKDGKMRKIKIAQIGTSRYSHGSVIFDTVKGLSEIFEIVGYAMPEGEREKFPDRMDSFEGYRELTVEEILSDASIEAVIIETEEIYLTKYARLAVGAGKHIHMEKPGGLSEKEFEALIKEVKRGGKIFHTGYMYRYNPVISEAIRRVRAGELGEIVGVEAQMNCWHGEAVTRWLSELDGGMMFYLGCHMIDLVLLLQGEPERIIPFNKSSGRFEGCDSRDVGFAVLEYKNGASFVKVSASEHGGFTRRQLVITGTKGRIAICPLEVSVRYPLQYTEYNECASEDWGDTGTVYRSEEHDRYALMMSSFAEMVRGERENPYTPDYELALFKAIKKCCE